MLRHDGPHFLAIKVH